MNILPIYVHMNLSEQHGVIGSVVAEILEMLCPMPSKCVKEGEAGLEPNFTSQELKITCLILLDATTSFYFGYNTIL